jgi:hypothetical protein
VILGLVEALTVELEHISVEYTVSPIIFVSKTKLKMKGVVH